MIYDSAIHSDEYSITFPLTLSKAVRCLAAHRTENIQSLNSKNKNQIYNKTWQQLSTRLRLIFKNFPQTYSKNTYKIDYFSDEDKMLLNCNIHQLSQTRVDNFYRKLRYIYYAVTMCYIQHKKSNITTNDVPLKWLQNKKFSTIDLKIFIERMEHINDLLPDNPQTDTAKNEMIDIDVLPSKDIISIIDICEELVISTYDYITKNYISPQRMRWLLSGIEEYSTENKYEHLFNQLYKSSVEKKLTEQFAEYNDFCIDFGNLANTYNKAYEHIHSASSAIEQLNVKTLPPAWDKASNTETEVSQLEFYFFSYLLEAIPQRTPTIKENIANQLYYGKWEVLSQNVREIIVGYIDEMNKTPERLARFLNIGDPNDKVTADTLQKTIDSICFQIEHPHHYNVFNDIMLLYSVLQGNQETMLLNEIDKIEKIICTIHKNIKKAKRETM